MPLYSLGDLAPRLGEGAWAAPSADLIGDVRLGARASVWFGAVLRGDNTPLILGEETNFQDGSVGHSDAEFPLTIGARVTVGHQAILHGCTVADDCLVGMGARILNGAVIEPECIVGAGALITEGKSFPERSLIVGSPARAVRSLDDAAIKGIAAAADIYVRRFKQYAKELKPIG
jgi:carbonic anhydrase/acetyltransferase-like protein (isoleucine patch superfamily)